MTTRSPRRRVAVVGYASIDRAITIGTPLRPGHTAIVTGRNPGLVNSNVWSTIAGEPGGIGYTATALANRGVETHAITWVGDDPAGGAYVDRLLGAGVVVDGIDVDGPTSPSSLLVYDPDGVCTCLFDPGSGTTHQLTPQQREILDESTHVVLMIAPADVTAEVLELIEDRHLTFVMKADEQAQPEGTCAAAVQRASLVFCNHVERALIESFLHPGQSVVTTAGAGSVRVEQDEASTLIENRDVLERVTDLTGAGDTLAGACLASMLAGNTIEESVRAGMAAATDLLQSRPIPLG